MEVAIVNVPDYYIYGQRFEGRYDSDKLVELVETMRIRLENEELEGELVIVNYFDDRREKRGDLLQFIGALNNEESFINKNAGLELLKLENDRAIESTINIVKLVMPSPEKIKNQAFELAESENLTLAPYSIERYADKQLIIQFPIEN